MKSKLLFTLSLLAFALSTRADVPPAEKLLPNDTLVLLTAPDFTKFRTILKDSPQGQFWNDAAMKPFKDKFMSKFKADLVAPLEKELGVKFEDYKGLAQGQFTFAVTQNGWQGKTNEKHGWILLLDTKGKCDVLKTTLSSLKKKWIDSGKQTKTEKIREIEFTTLITSTKDVAEVFDNVFPNPKSNAEGCANGFQQERETAGGGCPHLQLPESI